MVESKYYDWLKTLSNCDEVTLRDEEILQGILRSMPNYRLAHVYKGMVILTKQKPAESVQLVARALYKTHVGGAQAWPKV